MVAPALRQKGKYSLRMWILLGIFLILAAVLIHNHIHQVKHHTEDKVVIDDSMDY